MTEFTEGMFHSLSATDSCDLSPPHSNQRPRSASLHASLVPTAGQLQVQGKRKSLRTLTRSRPSSARFGRRGSDSLSLEQEATTGIYKVDNAFAKIRSQLVRIFCDIRWRL